MAYTIRERNRCPRCGTFPDKWLDERRRENIANPPYQLRKDHCWGCENMEMERKQIPDSAKNINLYFVRS